MIKWPGSIHGARMFAKSYINQLFGTGRIPACYKISVENEDPVPVCVLRSCISAIAYCDERVWWWRSQEQYFGCRLSSIYMMIECAFGRLKARFGALCCDMDLKMPDLHVINSCFVLHTLCDLQKESLADGAINTS